MIDRKVEAAVDRLLRAYSAYYDVERCHDGNLVAKAFFHSRGEKYLLTRSVNLWSVEDNEYVFVYAGDELVQEDLEHAIQISSKMGMSMIKPNSEHRSSMITTILIFTTIDKCCVKHIRTYREHRDFGFMLRGWMDHRVAALEMSSLNVVSNRAGRDVAKNLYALAGTESRR